MRSEGYQIVEPGGLDGLIRQPRNNSLAVVVLSWVIEELRGLLGQKLDGVSLTVIRVSYVSEYPAIGVKYETEREDVGPLLEEAIERLLKESPVSRLITFITTQERDWGQATAGLMQSGDPVDPTAS